MTDSNHGSVPVRYFCTAGNGMESFLVEEVKRKVAAQDVIHLQGKVIFSSSANINNIVNLKSAERLFLLLNHEAPIKLPAHINRAKASSLLQSYLTGDKNEVARVVMLWLSLQGALKDRSTNYKVQPSATVGGKRGDNDEQSLVIEDRYPGDSSRCKRQRLEYGNPDDTPMDQQDKLLPSVDSVTFRICCKCSGSLSRYFSTQDVSKVLGASLTTLLGWRVDLKNPHLEVNVNLTDDYCLQGIPLTKFPLANRNYVQTTGLRSTVAWAMASMAQIQPGSFVVDPMCGVGTILIEAAKEHNGAFFLGIDNDDEQLVKANENIVYAHLEDRMQVLKASSLVLPLHSASVDTVVCDLPFGRKFSTKIDAAKDLPPILYEMTRVLRVGGILVLLLSPQLSCLIKRLIAQEDVKSNSTDSQTEKQDCLSDGATCTKQLLSEGQNNGPPSAQETKYGLKRTHPLSSLRHEKTVRVSLGAIDGLMHKYVKLDPCFK
ncbi:THUMP domain-containing protein 2 [Boleophthalmus pectinirostris]|uniref:THUMP domain-containing protein 2 n=1 Tax=Boleophthalmus pectinirostris TaxID=150288 RepID=UPI002430B396|nr:THUMP domain-containing protein 2 [Boleophthalmus pectinirostris]